MRHDADEGMLRRQVVEHAGSPVVAAVVDDHQLAGIRQRQQRLAGEPYELGKILCLILRRHEDAHIRRRRIRREAHNRFRMRAGRMPS